MEIELEKGQDNQMCLICGKLFKKLSKKKIHMLTHNEVFKNLSIDKSFFWSDDRTKMICIDCGKEFNQHGHMKVHIALVHYQLQNKDNLDTLSISDVEVETLDCDEKKRSKPKY